MRFAQRGRSLDPPFVIARTHNGFGISHESIFITTQLLNVCCDVPFFLTQLWNWNQAKLCCRRLMKMSQTTQAICVLLFLNQTVHYYFLN